MEMNDAYRIWLDKTGEQPELNRELRERVVNNTADCLRRDAQGGRRTVILITHDEELAEDMIIPLYEKQ